VRIALLDAAPAARHGGRASSLAGALASHGHDVTLLCPGGGARELDLAGFAVRPLWRSPRLPAQRFYEDHLELAPAAIWRLSRGRFELAHAFVPALAWAATQVRRFGGPAFAYSHRGELTRRWLVDRHYRLEMMLAIASAASACFVEDDAAAAAFRRYLLREPKVVEPAAAAAGYEAAYAALGA
jgi:hypothetical protein